MRKYQSKKRAFTLIELLVVIAIIAITTSNSIKVKGRHVLQSKFCSDLIFSSFTR